MGGARYTQESTHWFQQAQEWGVSALLVLGENLIHDVGSGRRVSAVAATVHAPCVSEAVCAVRRGRARVGGRWVAEGPGRAVGLRQSLEGDGLLLLWAEAKARLGGARTCRGAGQAEAWRGRGVTCGRARALWAAAGPLGGPRPGLSPG